MTPIDDSGAPGEPSEEDAASLPAEGAREADGVDDTAEVVAQPTTAAEFVTFIERVLGLCVVLFLHRDARHLGKEARERGIDEPWKHPDYEHLHIEYGNARCFLREELPKLGQWLERADGEEWNSYFLPGTRRPPVKKGDRHNSKPRKDHVKGVRLLWADLDPPSPPDGCDDVAAWVEERRADILAQLQEFEPAPSFMIDSGGGYQAFWILREEFAIDPPVRVMEGEKQYQLYGEWTPDRDAAVAWRKERISEVERYLGALCRQLDGDDGTWNVDRVMRLPFTWNNVDPDKARRKGRERRPTSIVSWHPERVYGIEEMPCLPQHPRSGSSGKQTVAGESSAPRPAKLPDADLMHYISDKHFEDRHQPLLHDLASWKPEEAGSQLDDDQLKTLSDRTKELLFHGALLRDCTFTEKGVIVPKETIRRDGKSVRLDRNKQSLAFAAAALEDGLKPSLIASLLVNSAYGISAHSLDQADTARAAVRTVGEAISGIPDPDGFASDGDGVPYNTCENFRLALSKLGVRVWRDLFAGRDMVDGLDEFDLGPELTDEAERRLRFLLGEQFGFKRVPKEAWHEFLSDECWLNRRHPAREYFESLPQWDGVPRVERLLVDYFGAEDTKIHREFGRLHMCAAVKRALSPGEKYDEVLILEGAQGGLKSSGIKALCPRPVWFLDDLPLGADAKVVIEQTQGKLFVELAELNGLSKKEIDRVKAMVSRQSDRARAAYGRRAADVPRQFVFWGTTNDGEYLRDQTGNRRFWPVTVGVVDLEAIIRDRDQLWAEAVHLVMNGASTRLDPKFYEEAAKAQAERTQEDPFERRLSEALDELEGVESFRVLSQDLWEILDVPVERQPQHSRGFGEACKRLGLRQQTMRWNGRRWSFRVRGDERKADTFRWNGSRLELVRERTADGEEPGDDVRRTGEGDADPF